MQQVIVLGSASAVPTLDQENTHLIVLTGKRVILVDCPGSPIVRITQSGIDPQSVTDLILTHFHPDHVSGLASFLMSLWLLGRKQGIKVYGLAETIQRAQEMMTLYDWHSWPNFYPIEFVVIKADPLVEVIADEAVRVLASPVKHLIPAIGLRFEFQQTQKTLTYSCDTEPSPSVVTLARDADVLIHEATGDSIGHSSARQAGEAAQLAGVKALYLIHYPPRFANDDQLVLEAAQSYAGPIRLAKDFEKVAL